ncbi:hypothetical protein pEaSNUABM29_00119 [Erwinia phage pEa_SNUABM_29]|nr:hypothetical protein pEaSNUABM29_00119 [Erwinia phage pEa_SNUABM_29]
MAKNDLTTLDQRTEGVTRADSAYSSDEQFQVKLIATQLDEAGNGAGPSKASGTQAEKDAYNKLHQSFRALFKLRGQAFLDAFYIFVEAANKYRNGIFYAPSVNKRVTDNFPNRDEREAFVIFINMLVRYARCTNKANFSLTNDVNRLAKRVSDPDLQSLIIHAFGG